MYLTGVVATTDVVECCTGVNIAIMLGGFPGEEGMERQDDGAFLSYRFLIK